MKTPVRDFVEGDKVAFVVTTDFESGAYSAVDQSDNYVSSTIDVIHKDSVCRWDPASEYMYVVSRLGADALEVIDPYMGWTIIREFSLEAGSNAQDIAIVDDDMAYVARLGEPDLLVINPQTGDTIRTIDLSPYDSGTNPDGNPDAAWLLLHENLLYVVLQKLVNFVPDDIGSILIIEPDTGNIIEEIPTTGSNIVGKMHFANGASGIVLAQAGQYDELDGGIEIFDTSTREMSGFVVTEEELGGDIIEAAIVSQIKGYAVIGVPNGNTPFTKVVSFNPSTGKKTGDVLESPDWVHFSLVLTPDQTEIWVGDRTRTLPGIRIIDVETDGELTDIPIDVGLPPYMICFVE